MTIGDLLKAIKGGQKEYGKDFLNWEVYTEQITQRDRKHKRQTWEYVKDSEGWEYFRCCGYNTEFPDKKIFTVNVNY